MIPTIIVSRSKQKIRKTFQEGKKQRVNFMLITRFFILIDEKSTLEQQNFTER